MRLAFGAHGALVDLCWTAIHPNGRKRAQPIRAIADSIAGCGFLVPILIDDDWRHIAGHGRDVAARLLDLKGIPQGQQAEFVRENCLTEPWD